MKPTLKLVKRPSMAMKRAAVRLFSSDLVPLSVSKRNRRAWIAATMRLGDSGHILKGAPVKWGTQLGVRPA